MSSFETLITSSDSNTTDPKKETLLVIDDDPSVQRGLQRYFKFKYTVMTAANGAEGMATLSGNTVHCIVLDVKMKGANGFEIFHELKRIRPGIPIIFYTGFQDEHDIKSILNQYKPQGYFGKGESISTIESTIEKAITDFKQALEAEEKTRQLTQALEKEKAYSSRLNNEINSRYRFDALKGTSTRMAELRELCRKAAHSDITVFIQGETGTGKELVANIIHSNSSRRHKPLLIQNCAAIPDHLFESEFFGHKKGAFTGAISDKVGLFDLADKGTVFLDEIGDLSLPMQAKLLRLLQEGEVQPVGSNTKKYVDVRVISATNKSLEKEVKAGNFREDLYYRLSVFSITPPPLRRIRDDIPLLTRYLMDKYNHNSCIENISDEAISALMSTSFPGNVRQLENEIERAMVMAGKIESTLEIHHFSSHLADGNKAAADRAGKTLKEKVIQFETRLIQTALDRHKGNKTMAAKALGISRVGLNNKIKRYNII